MKPNTITLTKEGNLIALPKQEPVIPKGYEENANGLDQLKSNIEKRLEALKQPTSIEEAAEELCEAIRNGASVSDVIDLLEQFKQEKK